MGDDDYKPAERPPGPIPGGDRVRFEREGGVEQSMFGGDANDVSASIMRTTERNMHIFSKRIIGIGDVVGDLGNGSLQEITFKFEDGSFMIVRGIALEIVTS